MTHLSTADYKVASALMPIVCMDLFVRDEAGRVLLGWRKNPPASGSWFIPGGRIRKGERLGEAFARLTQQELGLTRSELPSARLSGVFDHFYDTDFTGDPEATTHYVVLAYELPAAWTAELRLPQDVQHQDWCWLAEDQLLMHPEVHPWTKAYFADGRRS
jgi:colanic acid biosynthesis protein WcaH